MSGMLDVKKVTDVHVKVCTVSQSLIDRGRKTAGRANMDRFS